MAVHTFEPEMYHSTLGLHKPVLHIADGDIVSTSTVDARGFDSRDKQVSEKGNPMTGPFYIAEAEPGDELIVEFQNVFPNRSTGWSSTKLAPGVLDPRYVAKLAPPGSRETAIWHIDPNAGSVMLSEPHNPHMSTHALPLEPMIGCFGVCPPGGSFIPTTTSGPHGGNMDYRAFGTGCRVSFPVFVPGALFFLGDGHARQGDGEIAGTGVEISLDVTFRVSVRKHRSLCWPSGENETHFFTIGNARPLDQALQHATTEMARRLSDDFGVSHDTVQFLLGQAVEYDICNVFNPAYSVACKVPRALLET